MFIPFIESSRYLDIMIISGESVREKMALEVDNFHLVPAWGLAYCDVIMGTLARGIKCFLWEEGGLSL